MIKDKDRDNRIAKASLKTRKKAQVNIIKWGVQDVDTLLKAMMEELGEVATADLENEGKDRIIEEARDLGALCLQLEVLLAD